MQASAAVSSASAAPHREPTAARQHESSHAPVPAYIAPGALGLTATVPLIGQLASQTVSLPAGVTWTSAAVQVDWPLQIQSGSIDVSDAGGRLLAIRSPADIAKPQAAVIPLRARPNQGYQFTLASFMRFRGPSQTCGYGVSNVGPTVHIRLLGYRVGPVGRTVASYLTGPIQQLVLRVSPDAPLQTKQAALQLESTVVAHDPDTDVAVSLVSNRGPAPQVNRFGRVVTFSGGSTVAGSVSVGPRGMMISGDGTAADRQVTLLGTKLVPLLQAQRANAISVPGAVHLRGATMSLGQLGVTSTAASGIGNFGLPIGFSQAGTGSPVTGASFSLHGTNGAPAPGTGATLTLFDGTIPVASTVLARDHGWALTGTLPQSALQRYVGLTLQVGYFAVRGGCGSLLPLSVSVDPSSGFTFTPGTAAGEGFDGLPQALLPTTDVVLSRPASFTQLQQAALVLAGAQRLSGAPFEIMLWPENYLPPKATPSIVVADAGSALASELTPTRLSGGAVQFVSAGQTTEVRVGAHEAFLSAGRQPNGGATLSLIISSANPAAGWQLLGALGSSQARWSALSGDTAVLAPGGEIATAQVAAAAPVALSQVAGSWLDQKWVWALLGAAAVIFVLIVARTVRRLRAIRAENVPRGPGDRWRIPERRRDARRETDR
ncbi:hypothetical protein AYO39_01100 [Actinobacteria bacterium SCGC AG-212-D09]|nr:hypothetical protein AYO39_01100 [Actinobacteria bacterium SCGC AG-212-D09]